MATLRRTCLLSILLVNLQTCPAAAGLPATPTHPECFIPCDEKSCDVNIHCSWDPRPDPRIPTNYSLHWKSNNREWTSSSSVIRRDQFSNDEELHVWVEARNQHGSVQSQAKVFNTAHVFKPPPPNIILRQQEPLEIAWQPLCAELHFSLGTCDVRNRTEDHKVWHEHEGEFSNIYTFESLKPCTVYEFQVRCGCRTSLTSEWSTIQRTRGPENAPVGELDIWKDCGTYPASAECALTWKILPISQACYVILGYEITLQHSNGTFKLINVSTAEPGDTLLCYETQCYLNSSLKDVSSVTVSAFNTYGATVPANLTILRPDQGKDEQAISLKVNEENLTVSWDLPSLNLKEYVVQYKQVGPPPGQGFDWVKVSKNETTVFFKGQFTKYTPFQVSLFTLSHSRKIHHLSSVIGYSVEGIPPAVPLFKVISIAATHVILFWESIPLSKQNGVILYYQIRLDSQNVHNVNASPQYENGTFKLTHLSPDQEYEVWISAVTKAGSGNYIAARFKTKLIENHAHLIGTLAPLFLVIICIPFLYCFCRVENKICDNVALCFCEKVPDPRNSQIFGHVKHQINDPLSWICIPTIEAHPEISVLEVVKMQPRALTSTLRKISNSDELTLPVTEDGGSQMDWQDEQSEDAVGICDTTGHRYGREEYSKMVDSDEERDKEEEEDGFWNSSEEEACTSGYEKHFMPTPLEILESRNCQGDI